MGGHPSLIGGDALLERNEELGRIDAALADALNGRGRFVVVEGPAGIGKTVFLAAVRTVASGGGMRVLRSRGSELERDFAFGVVRQLFEPLSRPTVSRIVVSARRRPSRSSPPTSREYSACVSASSETAGKRRHRSGLSGVSSSCSR